MKKKLWLLAAPALLVSALAGCGGGGGGGGDASKVDPGTSTPASTPTSPTSGGGTSGGSSSEDSGEEVTEVVYQGKLRIWYHRDDSSYDNLTIYLWNQAVDGREYEWTGSDPTFGVYFDIDLSENEQFKEFPSSDIRMIVKVRGTWSGQSQDTICNFGSFQVSGDVMNIFACAAENGVIETYKIREDALGDRIEKAYFDTDWKTVRVTGTGTPDGRSAADVGKAERYELYRFDRSYYQLKEEDRFAHKKEYLIQQGTANTNSFSFSLDSDLVLSNNYELDVYFALNPSKAKAKFISVAKLYDTPSFDTNYEYKGDDLGVTFGADGSRTFKVWAPTSTRVQLRLYQSGTPVSLGGSGLGNYAKSYDMELGEKGVWSFVEKESEVGSSIFRRRFYTYNVTNAGGTSEVVDPYAKSAGINGIRGAIVNLDTDAQVQVEGFADIDSKLPAIKSANNLTVYEAHIRDLTADKTWTPVGDKTLRGGYNAFVEEGTTYTDPNTGVSVKTGFDHIKELGVNAIQLLPVFDSDNDERKDSVYVSTENGGTLNPKTYNWGYDPKNYNVVEGAYSSDPTSAYTRIAEFRKLITKAADNGIRIIMDVVYNHMSSVSNNSFTKLVPQYFFRTDANGNYTDGSGCGNEVATQRSMASKFIVDSVAHWAKDFKIKGFRFDLMGCIDTGTMKKVRAKLNEIDPTIVVYGEGWTGGGTALPGNMQSSTNNTYNSLNTDDKFPIGCFNDTGRDGSKGNTLYADVVPSNGWINEGSNVDNVYNTLTQILGENRNAKNALGGDNFKMNPNQTVNYLACHDNYTLYDQINYLFHDRKPSDEALNTWVCQAATGLTALSLMGQGIGFINGGDEIFRQKLIDKDDVLFEDMVDTYRYGRYEKIRVQGDEFTTSSTTKLPAEAWGDFEKGTTHYYDASGNRINAPINASEQEWKNWYRSVHREVSDWIEGDGCAINSNRWLVRNSYKYGDAVNSFKWNLKADSRATAHFNSIKEIIALRAKEMGNTLGQTQAQIADNGTTCWNFKDLFNVDDEGHVLGSKTDLLAGHYYGQTDHKSVYIFVNKGNSDASIGIGNGTLEVLYDTHKAAGRKPGDRIKISNNSITCGKFEVLIARQIA